MFGKAVQESLGAGADVIGTDIHVVFAIAWIVMRVAIALAGDTGERWTPVALAKEARA